MTGDVGVRIAVPVATLWVSPGKARAIDSAITGVDPATADWLARMSLAQRKGLYGRVETQALYGQEVRVLASSGAWTKVAVADQPSPRNAAGYPGWVPTVQLRTGTASTPTAGPSGAGNVVATVTARTTALRDPATGQVVMTVSYGTRLPVTEVVGDRVGVLDLAGSQLEVQASEVAGENGEPPVATGEQVVAEARKFLGLPYLWGGTSGLGYDCSGLTHSVYAVLGVTIPRDATPQFHTGTRVPRSKLRPGDLVFFRNSSGIHHVGLYIGANRMIHSPRTGRPVAIVSLSANPYAREYAGARRILG